jgi:ABC-type Fe3+ transport system permease subunit
MLVVRWLRSLVRFALGLVLLSPVVALPVAVLLDRGPAGETRISPHLFSLVLWIFDDFAWTCSRNSLIFATVISLLSFGFGGALGWIVGRRRFWGRGILSGFVIALLAVPPAFLALGLDALLGAPRPWPWPFLTMDERAGGASLESWRGLALWIEWLWTTLPWGVALVMVVTAAAVERLEPSWEDAARLTGAGRFRAWRALSWPLVRPSSARAAALVFLFAVAEPGTPQVLGLRRTLAFQAVEIARRSEPFPQAAVWALMMGLFGFAGWLAWRWAGTMPILVTSEPTIYGEQRGRLLRAASPARGLASSLLLGGFMILGWLPVAGLVQLVMGESRALPFFSSEGWRSIFEQWRRLSEPPLPAIVVNSVILGLEVAGAAIAMAWLGPGSRASVGSRSLVARFAGRLAFLPLLVQGIGFLALPWLASLASNSLAGSGQFRPLAALPGRIAAELDVFRTPWIIMSFFVALSLVPRFMILRRGEDTIALSRYPRASARDAIRLAGGSRAQIAWLSQVLPRGRWLAWFAWCALVGAIAATNLAPGLLFEPWIDGQTIGPAVLELAASTADARGQAALLALCAIATNLAALALAWLTSALPRRLELE